MSDFLGTIRGLDGLTQTLVSQRVGEWDVMVGGGPELFVLTASAGGGARTANALSQNELAAGATVELTVGGQAIEGPASYALTLAEVVVALEDLESKQFPAHRWEQIG